MEALRPADPGVVGRYRLAARLGQGGSGTVFLGRSHEGGRVAVRVIRPDLASDDKFRARLKTAADEARKVTGPRVARLLDADPDGSPPWLVGEYVAGPTLQAAVAAHGPLPVRAVRRLGAGLALALSAIHDADVVHRDLKPANVLLGPNGPRVTDVALARAFSAAALEATGGIGSVPGLPAPEQVTGGSVTAASDVFALGGVLCHALGVKPFGGGPATAIAQRVLRERPDLDGVPEELRDVIASCLVKRPAGRPGAAELAELLGGEDFPDDWLPSGVRAMITRQAADAAVALTGGTRKGTQTPGEAGTAAETGKATVTGGTGDADAEDSGDPGPEDGTEAGAGAKGLPAQRAAATDRAADAATEVPPRAAAGPAKAESAKTAKAETAKAGTAKAGTAKAETAKAETAKAGTAKAAKTETTAAGTAGGSGTGGGHDAKDAGDGDDGRDGDDEDGGESPETVEPEAATRVNVTAAAVADEPAEALTEQLPAARRPAGPPEVTSRPAGAAAPATPEARKAEARKAEGEPEAVTRVVAKPAGAAPSAEPEDATQVVPRPRTGPEADAPGGAGAAPGDGPRVPAQLPRAMPVESGGPPHAAPPPTADALPRQRDGDAVAAAAPQALGFPPPAEAFRGTPRQASPAGWYAIIALLGLTASGLAVYRLLDEDWRDAQNTVFGLVLPGIALATGLAGLVLLVMVVAGRRKG